MGPVISPESKERVERLIESGIKQVCWQLLRVAASRLGGIYGQPSRLAAWSTVTLR